MKQKLHYLQQQLTDYENGILHLYTEHESIKEYVSFLNGASTNGIVATSRVDPKITWAGETWKANLRYLQRGGTVKRIFFAKSKDEYLSADGSELRKLEKQQSDADVEVHICFEDEIRDPSLVRDFIISEHDGIGIEFGLAADNRPWSAKLITNQQYILELMGCYLQLLPSAHLLDEL